MARAWVLLAGAATVATAIAQSSPVDVSLYANWPSFPASSLSEAGVFLGALDASLFWAFHAAVLSRLSAAPSLLHDYASMTHVALSVARPLLSPLSFDVLRLSLDSRASSPALEMTRQLGLASPARALCATKGSAAAAGEEAWAEIAGAAACTADELKALLGATPEPPSPAAAVPPPRTYPGDHEFPAPAGAVASSSAAGSAPLLVVWGALGGAASSALHAVAAEAASRGAVRYVWRTFLGSLPSDGSAGAVVDAAAGVVDPPSLPSPVTWLAGYGVSLDVKSTEYKAVDERAPAQGATRAPESAQAPRAVLPTDADPTIPRAWQAALQALGEGASGSSEAAHAALAAAFSGTGAATPASTTLGINSAVLSGASVEGPAASAPSVAKLDRILAKAAAGASSGGSNASLFAPFSEGPLAPWETVDLSLQAAAYVMDAAHAAPGGDGDPLARLVTVTANFPSLARFLSRLPVPPQLRAEAFNNTRRMAGPVTAALTVNGISVDPSAPTFNIFSLLNVLSAEAGVVGQLDTLPLSLEDRRRVQALAVPAVAAAQQQPTGDDGSEDSAESVPSDVVRVDVWVEEADAIQSGRPLTHPVVHWLNDVSDTSSPDSPYRGMPTSLNGLLRHTWQLHPIALNLYSVILVGDLSTVAALRGVATAGFLAQARVPIRYGVLALPGNTAAESAALEAKDGAPLAEPRPEASASGLHLALLHAEALMTYGPSTAAAFLSGVGRAFQARAAAAQEAEMAATLGHDDDAAPPPEATSLSLSVAEACEAFSAAVSESTGAWSSDAGDAQAIAALLDAGGHLRAAVSSVVSWAASRGLVSVAPCLVVNGRLRTGGGVDLQVDGMPLIGEDMQSLQRAVSLGALDDSVTPSVYAAFLGRATRLSAKQARAAARATGSSPSPLTLPGAGTVVPRFNPAIFAPASSQLFLPLSAPAAAPLLRWTSFVGAAGTGDTVKPVSLTVLDDVGSQPGLASIASALSFVRPLSAVSAAASSVDAAQQQPGPCFVEAGALAAGSALPPGASCLLLPDRFAGDLRSSVRVGVVNVGSSGAGDLVALLWAAVTAGAGSGGAEALDAARQLALQVRVDEQAAVLSAVVDVALGAASAVSPELLSAEVLASALAASLFNESSATFSESGVRPKVLSRLGALLPAFTAAAVNGAAPESASPPQRTACDALMSGVRESASIARALLQSTLPLTPSVGAADGRPALRAVAANGRVLSLAPLPASLPARCVVAPGGADATPASTTANSQSPALARSGGEASLGLCVGPLELAALVQHERNARGSAVAALLASPSTKFLSSIEPDDVTAAWMSSVVMAASAAVGTSLTVGSGNVGGRMSGRVSLPRALGSHVKGEYTSFSSEGRGGHGSSSSADVDRSVGLHVFALLDPATETAQRLAPLLVLLRDRLGASVTVQLLPSAGGASGNQEQLPLRSFYRFVMPPGEADGGSATDLAASLRPRASFVGLPGSSLLTMQLSVPEPWNVQTAAAPVDLDNMRLGAGPALRVTYVLRDILVAGQCYDRTPARHGGTPPNGLQLELKSGDAVVSDTLVMVNLNYFQLKANRPGVYAVTLAPGRGKDLFAIVGGAAADASGSGGGYQHHRHFFSESDELTDDAVNENEQLEVVVRDFTGPITQLSVRKRPGMESVPLLDSVGAAGSGTVPKKKSTGLWAAMSRNLFGGSGSGSNNNSAEGGIVACVNGARVTDGSACTIVESERPTYHIFSLASGHLYERFLKIMMLSATKRTPSGKLVFWLVENFLSPQFKASVPALTAKLGFDVRFVTYKWPNWLRGQTEKQRLIWGHKILFLDVLFPLTVDKVIYIDADQIIRSDLGELWAMDLEGAPYAFTPFCTSRQDTLGYQFWRQGFWKEHLGDRQYHISALFVVDLAAFRRSAVGDSLRGIYDNLSRDPNSLSNLDQDLPNYAQTMVPIKSLPQEWLWCESWCSEESKARAKTVDLCNNPRYKEPKLQMAQRVIAGPLFPESWLELDAEVVAAEAAWQQERLAEAAVGVPESHSAGSDEAELHGGGAEVESTDPRDEEL